MSKLAVVAVFSMAVLAMCDVEGSGHKNTTDDRHTVPTIGKPVHHLKHPNKELAHHPTRKTSVHNHHLNKPHHHLNKPHHHKSKPRHHLNKPHHHKSKPRHHLITKVRPHFTQREAWPTAMPDCKLHDGDDFDKEEYEEFSRVVKDLLEQQNYDTRRMVPWSACSHRESRDDFDEFWTLVFFDSKTKVEHSCIVKILHYGGFLNPRPFVPPRNFVATAPVCRLKNVDLCPGQLSDVGRCTYEYEPDETKHDDL